MSEPTPKIGKFKASTMLGKAAWRTLKLDKEMLMASVLSMLASVVLFGIFVAALIFTMPEGFLTDENVTASGDVSYYLLLAAYLFVTYLITNYFSGAIAHAALTRFRGGEPTLKGSLQAASAKFGPLAAFSGVQATVGLILNILEERLPLAGKIATWIAGAAWGIATMFVIPLIMDGKETRPLKAVKASAGTFTKVWGESIFIGIGLGIIQVIFTLLMIFFLAGTLVAAISLSSWALGIAGASIFIVVVVLAAIIMSTLRTIVMTAAYYYASTQQLPTGFDDELVRVMFRPKKKWLQ